MKLLIKTLTLVATTVITLDVILMIINGTMLYVVLTLIGFYMIASLAFKQSAYRALRQWIRTGTINRDSQKKQPQRRINSAQRRSIL